MATKEQERNTLEKIRQMVADLGENSYLATAFNGAFTLAADNIEMDAAFSTQEYINMAHDAQAKIKDLTTQHQHAIDSLKDELESVKNKHQCTIKALEDTSERARKYAYEIDDLKVILSTTNLEIIKLKAKLYDHITKEELAC